MITQEEEQAIRNASKNRVARTDHMVWWGCGIAVLHLKKGGTRHKKMSLDTALGISVCRDIQLTIIPQED